MSKPVTMFVLRLDRSSLIGHRVRAQIDTVRGRLGRRFHLRDLFMLRALPAAFLTLVASLTLINTAHAQGAGVPDPFNQTRSSSFSYYGASDGALAGLLKSETVEPGNAQLCVTTTYTYDALGNKTASSTANCAGASGRALFASRGSSTAYQSQTVTVAGVSITTSTGVFSTSASNAVGHTETRRFDPRFGAVVSLTGPNSLTTSWVLDNFGRKVQETRADGTRTLIAYCYIAARVNDASSNSSTGNGDPLSCPAPAANEIPAEAVSFVHSEPRDSSSGLGIKNGVFSRTYIDRAGRTIRSVTEAFDDPAQPGGQGRLIAQDTDYGAFDVPVVSTQPYFLDTASSTSLGAADYGMSRTDYDVLGRVVAFYTADATTADNLGGSQPSVAFGSRGSRQAAKTITTYSALGSTTTNDRGQQRVEEKNIAGLVVRITDALGAQLAHQHDAFGNLVATRDALGNQTSTAYDLRGRKVSSTDPDTGLWQYDYNALGELVWQQNPTQRATTPTAQVTTMAYDLLGRLTSRVDPEYTSTWYYDRNADTTPCMSGSVTNRGAGKLCETSTTTGINRKLVYDSLGRPINTRTSIASGPAFASAISYQATSSRLASQTYPSGLTVNYGYTAKGFPNALTLATSATVAPLPSAVGGTPASGTTLPVGSVLWTAKSYNAWGRAEQTQYGNAVFNRSTFDTQTGRLTRASAGMGVTSTVLDHRYVWNSLGQLTHRDDNIGDGLTGAVSEDFSYDSIGRLQAYNVSAPAIPNLSRTVALQYNALGMMLYKSDVGVYSYGAQGAGSVRPHALLSVTGAASATYGYDANGNLRTASAGKYSSITYTSFNLPDSQAGLQGPAGTPKYTWVYDESRQRIKETRVSSAGARTTWTMHPDNQGGLGFECDSSSSTNCSSIDTNQRHYLNAGGGSIGVLVSIGVLPALTATQTAPAVLPSIALVKVEYWHKDHLGSLVASTDHQGSVTARYAYDPFGKRRQASGVYDASGTLVVDWTNNTNSGTDRGYTGHEHLDDVGLVHMNGRIFDPMLGRFMQADPFIQDATNLQNFDRYAYCFNDPLTCTDPSGYFFKKLFKKLFKAVKSIFRSPVFRIATVIAINVTFPGADGFLFTQFGFDNVVQQAAITGFTSGAVATGNIKGALQGAFIASSFAVVGNTLSGLDPLDATTSQVKGLVEGSGASGLTRVAAHGVAGCVTSEGTGGRCGPGALSAAFSEAATVNNFRFDGQAGAISAAIVGGTASVLGGGKFANGAVTASAGYLFNYCAHATTKCLGAWGQNLGKITLGGLGMFGGGALCTTGVGCALGSVGVITGASNVYEGADWVFNRDESTDGVNPIKRAITNAIPSANADLAFASMEVLGAGLALKAPIMLKDELWFTIYGIQRVPGLPITVPASSLPQGAFDAAGAAWDGANAAIDQAKKKRP